jgi:putative restriction endonuclease
MADRLFGEIEGCPEGMLFDSQEALNKAGVHRPTMAGISGTAEEGADSIVLSGGYEDDLDYGDEVVYTGHGGRDPKTSQQVADQEFASGNAGLARNKTSGLPVRVIRGAQLDSPFAPEHGYRYDGLYSVEQFWEESGISGHKVWRYRLVKINGSSQPPVKDGEQQPQPPARRQTTTMRIARDTEKSRRIKELYKYTCQVCGVRLETPAGPYAEGAHIIPLGIPHNGPDEESNILCLCPNHHVLLDVGAITLADDFRVLGVPGEPKLFVRHDVGKDYVQYHREHFGVLTSKRMRVAYDLLPKRSPMT